MEKKKQRAKNLTEKFTATLEAEGFHFRVLILFDEVEMEWLNLTGAERFAELTQNVCTLAENTGRSVESILNEISCVIKVFAEDE